MSRYFIFISQQNYYSLKNQQMIKKCLFFYRIPSLKFPQRDGEPHLSASLSQFKRNNTFFLNSPVKSDIRNPLRYLLITS